MSLELLLIDLTAALTETTATLRQVLAGASVPAPRTPDAVVDAAVGQTRLEVVDTPAPEKTKKPKPAPAVVAEPEPAVTVEVVAESDEITETDPAKLRLMIQGEVKAKLALDPKYKTIFDEERTRFGVVKATLLTDEQLVPFLLAVRKW